MLRITVRHPCVSPICGTIITNYEPWKNIFLKVIERSYGETEYYPIYIDQLREFVNGSTVMLETFNVQTIMWIAGLLGIDPILYHTRYAYLGRGGRAYPKHKVVKAVCEKFSAEEFNEPFVHPHYPQVSEPFEKDLSILDALLTIGPEDTHKLLKINL